MERITKNKKIKRKRKHGYLSRKSSLGGRKVLKRRTLKRRKTLTR